jgi:hypothetical protein
MAFDWRAFVDLARELARQAASAIHPEALLRTALSRAYFGAFGHALDYAMSFLHFHAREDADDHGRLRDHL